MERYLTEEYKEKILKNLEQKYLDVEEKNVNNISLNGLDKDIIPYLKNINELDGMVTILSCMGNHWTEETKPRPEEVTIHCGVGVLWISFTEENIEKFWKNLDVLVNSLGTQYDRIESMERVFHVTEEDGYFEQVRILFNSRIYNPETTLDLIYDYLRNL